MAKFALFCALSLLSSVQTLYSAPGTPTVFMLKRTTNTLLAQKPVHPPICKKNVALRPNMYEADGSSESKVVLLESTVLRLENKVVCLEKILSDFLQVLQTCDDIALLEKNTCSAVVYNEELTQTRPLRLLRCELKTLHDKFFLK